MKTKIGIGVLILLNIIFFIFGITKQIEASAQRELAAKYYRESQEQQRLGMENAEMARVAMANEEEAKQAAAQLLKRAEEAEARCK